MPFYKPIKALTNEAEKERLINNLLRLRQELQLQIPEKTAARTLLLATWNLREFKGGNRLPESYYYIAEIIARFDLVALQEVAADLAAIEQVLFYLGSQWSYIVTDATEGSAGGRERIAFIYDTGKVSFMRIAGEVVLPQNKLVDGKHQFARTPFTVAFQAGWFRFMLTSVHIYFGKESGAAYQRRVAEIKALSQFLSKRAQQEDTTYILLGDFNITDPDDDTFKALCSGGFFVPEQLQLPSNAARNKHYAQIAFKQNEKRQMPLFKEEEPNKAGVFDYYQILFTKEELDIYQPYFNTTAIENKSDKQVQNYYLNKWRTFQLSDHLPLWVELQVDFSDQYLRELKTKPPGDEKSIAATVLRNLNALKKDKP